MYRAQVHRAEKGAYDGCTSAEDRFKKDAWPAFPSPENDTKPAYARDDIAPLFYTQKEGESVLDTSTDVEEYAVKDMQSDDQTVASKARMAWMSKETHREKLAITPEDVVTVDFCNGYINFNNLQLELPYGNLKFDLQQYWDGQPVRYVCKNLKTNVVYFIVQCVFPVLTTGLSCVSRHRIETWRCA